MDCCGHGRRLDSTDWRTARLHLSVADVPGTVITGLIALVLLGGTSLGLLAGTGEPAVEVERIAVWVATESFRLDMADPAVAARAALSRFSQTTQPLHSVRDYALPASGGPSVPETTSQPLPPQYATTSEFEGPFTPRRAALADAILEAEGSDRVARELDYAQFLIAHMMLAEARAVILALPPSPDGPANDRAAGYLAISARLAGGGPGTLPVAWADDPLWPVVVSGTARDEDQLRASFQALADQSREIATAALPHLFDIALAGGHTAFAAEILAAAPAVTDLDGTGLLGLLRGRLALAQGAEDLAFDTFARVAEGQDHFAVEARIALAEVALKRMDPTLLPQVSHLLQEGLQRWRGDDTALRLRVHLARVAEDMGDIPTALETMSAILHDHPGTPEAQLAETRLGVMTGLFAQGIAESSVSLAEALHHVRRLDPALTGRGDWLAARKVLADRLADAGLHQAAKAEYAAIAQTPGAALMLADPAVQDAFAVSHAGLLLALDDRSTALRVLDRRGPPRDPAHLATIAALRLQAGGTALLPDALLAALKVGSATQIDDPAVQLALAKVAVATGEAPVALAAYDRALVLADQTERLDASRTAAEAGDVGRATLYAGGLTGDRAALRQAAVANLAAPRRASDRLSVSGASALITAASDAEAAVNALLAEDGK